MSDHQPRTDVRIYYLLPLVDDPKYGVTLLRVEPASDGRVRIHLHRGVDRTGFSSRLSGVGEPVWEAVAEAKETLVAPALHTAGLSGPEEVLAEVGEFLSGVHVGAGGVQRWGFDGLIPNDEWVLHLRQLAAVHDRLAPARLSQVADDPRVRERMAELVTSAGPHADALSTWLERAGEVREQVLEVAAAELHEQRVQEVLADLNPLAEDPQEHPNPDLPRIIGR